MPSSRRSSADRCQLATTRRSIGRAGPSVCCSGCGRAEQGDEIAGCSDAEAHAAVQALGALHAPALAHPTLAQEDWLNRPSPINAAIVGSLLPGFFERYQQRIAPEHRIVCERLAEGLDELIAAAEQLPRGLVHGDYRLDNLLFDLAGPTRAVTVVDWQTVTFARR